MKKNHHKSPDDLQQLWDKARDGCEQSLADLLETYRPYLLAIANASLGDKVRTKIAPSDLVQQALVRAHTGFPEFTGTSDTELQTWLRAILRHQLIDCRRAFRPAGKRDVGMERSLDDSSCQGKVVSDPAPDALAARNEEHELLNQVIEELPERERTVVRAYHGEGLTFAQIGEQLDCSTETVRRIWYGALAKLAKHMGT